jgi:hypothetical protein
MPSGNVGNYGIQLGCRFHFSAFELRCMAIVETLRNKKEHVIWYI